MVHDEEVEEYYRIRQSPNCFICNSLMEIIQDSVDIGVGVQTFTVGYECPNHYMFSVCNTCSVVEDGRPHYDWCNAFKDFYKGD